MNPERWAQIKPLFHSAAERPANERAEFIRSQCDGDESLVTEVESLLAAHDQASSFIEGPESFPATAGLEHQAAEPMVGRRIGAYQLVREIGRGGMAAVYLAERADGQYHKCVAIKLIKRGMDSDFIIRRFRNERQILAELDHPNIARLLDGGATEDGLPYFVMEYIDGAPITQYCDDKTLPIRERLTLFRSVCSAVTYAHQRSIVHRDIKPSNILISPDGTPKLVDFGIAKLLEPDVSPDLIDSTATALRLMTPEYASPEQVRGDPVTPASDVYSLGVLLYEILTGHRPYRIKSRQPHEIARVICEEEPEKPSTAVTRTEEVRSTDGKGVITVTPESVSKSRAGEPIKLRQLLDGDLDSIVLMALRKRPEQRYGSVQEFSEEIRRHLEGLPVIARKQMRWRFRAGLWARWKAVSVALLAATLLGAVLIYLRSKQPIDPRGVRSIAVIPFKSMSQESEDEYLGQGLADALITKLTNVNQMMVRPTSSVRRYVGKEQDVMLAGRELGVESVVEGTIQRMGDRIRVTVQLVNVRDGAPSWAGNFDERLTDMFAVEDSISAQVAHALKIRLTEQEQKQLVRRYTESSEAYQLYLKGRYFWNKRTAESYKKAIEYFERAAALDSQFALAYTGIADSYTLLQQRYAISAEEAFPRAEEAAVTALTIDESLAEAHTSFALIKELAHFDLNGAIEHYKRALDLSPNYATAHGWYGLLLVKMGRFDESVVELTRAQQLDPTSLNIAVYLASHYFYSRQYDRAIEEAKRAIEFDPNASSAYLILNASYEQKGMYDQAFEAVLRTQLITSNPEVVAPLKLAYQNSGIKGFWQKEIEILKEHSRRQSDLELWTARCHARLGNYELAMNELEAGYRNHSSRLLFAKVEPGFDGLRSDPRFSRLLARMGLEP